MVVVLRCGSEHPERVPPIPIHCTEPARMEATGGSFSAVSLQIAPASATRRPVASASLNPFCHSFSHAQSSRAPSSGQFADLVS